MKKSLVKVELDDNELIILYKLLHTRKRLRKKYDHRMLSFIFRSSLSGANICGEFEFQSKYELKLLRRWELKARKYYSGKKVTNL